MLTGLPPAVHLRAAHDLIKALQAGLAHAFVINAEASRMLLGGFFGSPKILVAKHGLANTWSKSASVQTPVLGPAGARAAVDIGAAAPVVAPAATIVAGATGDEALELAGLGDDTAGVGTGAAAPPLFHTHPHAPDGIF